MKTRHELSSGEDAVEVDSVGTPTYTTTHEVAVTHCTSVTTSRTLQNP